MANQRDDGLPTQTSAYKIESTARVKTRERVLREAEERGEVVDLRLLPGPPGKPAVLPVPLDPSKDPWERQPRESSRAYACFVVYRDLGPFERSIKRCAKELGVYRTVPQRMFAQWRWEERAAAWDAENQRAFDLARKDEQTKSIRSHFNASRALINLTMRLLQAQGTKPLPDSRILKDAAISLDKAIHHNRLALGLPTDVSRQDLYLKGLIEEQNKTHAEILGLLEEVLCDDCRREVRGRLLAIKRKVTQVAARAEISV